MEGHVFAPTAGEPQGHDKAHGILGVLGVVLKPLEQLGKVSHIERTLVTPRAVHFAVFRASELQLNTLKGVFGGKPENLKTCG